MSYLEPLGDIRVISAEVLSDPLADRLQSLEAISLLGGMDARTFKRTAQALARHATPDLTMNIYGRTREDRLSEVVEKVASAVLPEEKRAICVQRLAVGAEQENATSLENKRLRLKTDGGAEGNRTPKHRIAA